MAHLTKKLKSPKKKGKKIQHPNLEKEGMLDKNPVRTLKTA
jgi:hypothetical protein